MIIEMKKILSLFFFSLVGFVSLTSAKDMIRKDDLETFMKNPLYVVLDNNPMSDWSLKIREAVEKGWTLTKCQFINDTEFEKLRGDMDKSFLVRIKYRFPDDKVRAFYNFMTFTNGAAVKEVADMPEVCAIPLGYDVVNQESWGYKLLGFVRFAQNHIKLIYDNPGLISSNPLDYYNRNISDLKDKEIWMVEKDIAPDVRTIAKIREAYNGIVRIVKPEDIEQAIADKRENVVYLHKVGPEGTRMQARIYKALIGAGDDRIYYFDYHMMSKSKGDGFLKKDFKRISK